MIIINFVSLYPLSESTIVIELGKQIELETHIRVQTLSSYLEKGTIPALIEYVPAYTSVTIFYDCIHAASLMEEYGASSPYEVMKVILEEHILKIECTREHNPETVDIPVCYGGKYGPDLELVARYNCLSPEEVIKIHSAGTYLVYMIGFAPGFPYLGGLSEKIFTPRRETPRLRIPAGSVGIAGTQTGIYPLETPGGWQLIGKTPLRLFNPKKTPPTLLKAGINIQFTPISNREYEQLVEVEK